MEEAIQEIRNAEPSEDGDLHHDALHYLKRVVAHLEQMQVNIDKAIEAGRAGNYDEALNLGQDASSNASSALTYGRYSLSAQQAVLENRFRTVNRAWFIGLGEVNHRSDENKSYVSMGQVQLFLTKEDAQRGLGKIGFENGNSIGQFCDSKLNYVWGEASVTPLDEEDDQS